MSINLDIHRKFSAFSLDVSLNVKNESLALLGASGSGKSLTLSCIAGIMKPDRGRIVLDGDVLFDSERRINIKPQKRHTGLMFQNYALFPNMTVEQNIMTSDKGTKSEVNDILERFGIYGVKNLYPSQISGGQKQRTALARMLLSRPKILMLDEPFSALDSHLRFQIERELLNVIHDFNGTVIFVSHNRDEAFRICDHIAVIHEGHVEVQGTKSEVFSNPLTRNAAVLTGCKNISRAEITGKGKIFASEWGIELYCPCVDHEVKYAGIRMHSITHEFNEHNYFNCRVLQVIENPFSFTVMVLPLKAQGNIKPLFWEMNKELWQEIKSEVIDVYLPPENILMLKE